MKKIILVDDDITTRSLLKMLLSMEGYEVIIPDAINENLINTITEENPHALFIDVFLNHVSGIEIVRNIRAERKYNTVKILMTSGMDVKHDCLNAGADGFLMKPFMPDELINWLKLNIDSNES